MLIEKYEKRITKAPYYTSWESYGGKDHIKEDGEIDYSDLSEGEKLCLYVYAWNKSGIFPGKRGILKQFSWTNYRLQKIIKSLNGSIQVGTTVSELTGLLSGKGYYLNY